MFCMKIIQKKQKIATAVIQDHCNAFEKIDR